MSHMTKFKLFYGMCSLIILLIGSLFLSNLPVEGYLQANNNKPVTFQFGYFNEQNRQVDLREWMARSEEISLFAAADHLIEKKEDRPLFSLLPIFDSSSSEEQFNQNYVYLPNDLLPSYGRTVYAMDYGNARLLFMNSASLTDADSPQWEWLRNTVNDNKQVHNIVLLHEAPRIPAFWELLLKLGINLVLAEGEVYFPHAVVTQEAAEYRATESPEWGLWDVRHSFDKSSYILIIEGEDNQLKVKLQDQEGEDQDQLIQDVTSLRFGAEVNGHAWVNIQSLWKYHAGGKDVQAYVPEGFDVTGEHPILNPFRLPADDWRSPQYDDSEWRIGRAPLGHAQDQATQRIIQTRLPVNVESPTTYFRIMFDISEDPSTLKKVHLHILYEDGYVAYLNGMEISRDSIRNGLLDYRSLAMKSELNFYTIVPLTNSMGMLRKGSNTLAVEVHRSHPKAPNLLFDLSLSYER